MGLNYVRAYYKEDQMHLKSELHPTFSQNKKSKIAKKFLWLILEFFFILYFFCKKNVIFFSYFKPIYKKTLSVLKFKKKITHKEIFFNTIIKCDNRTAEYNQNMQIQISKKLYYYMCFKAIYQFLKGYKNCFEYYMVRVSIKCIIIFVYIFLHNNVFQKYQIAI